MQGEDGICILIAFWYGKTKPVRALALCTPDELSLWCSLLRVRETYICINPCMKLLKT